MINLYDKYSYPTNLDDHDKYEKLIENLRLGWFFNITDWVPVMHIIKKSPALAYTYCIQFKRKRFAKAEPYIIRDPYYAFMYSQNIIKKRWLEAEANIIEHPHIAYHYAKLVIKDRWPEFEQTFDKLDDSKGVINRYQEYFNISGLIVPDGI